MWKYMMWKRSSSEKVAAKEEQLFKQVALLEK